MKDLRCSTANNSDVYFTGPNPGTGETEARAVEMKKKNAHAGSESSTVLRQTLLPLLLLALQHTVLFLQVSDRQSPSDMEIGNNCSTNLKAIVVQPNEQYSKR